jgi:hypothetical protein
MFNSIKEYDIPARDPVSGSRLYVSELSSEDGSVTIRGRFRVPRVSQIDRHHQDFLETFLRCRGVISSVEKELGISYPTVRARLDSLLEALDLEPVKPAKRKSEDSELKRSILEQLENGTISAAEAKEKLKAAGK